MPDPLTVELVARALREHGYFPTKTDATNLIESLAAKGLLVVPADTARTGWLYDLQEGWLVYDSPWQTRYECERVIVAPDPRTEATDE